MTNFGKNIKKIRSIQKLSQVKFAELFDLTRASIGAYEEGRAEAKLDVINKIAKHFSISVDRLINHEITVNELYHFNIFDENLSGKINIGSVVLKEIAFINIPVVITQDLLAKPIADCIHDAENFIKLPHADKNQLAVLVDRQGFKYIPEEVHDNDILIISNHYSVDTNSNLNDRLWLIQSDKALYLGEIQRIGGHEFVFFSQQGEPFTISGTGINFMAPVETFISKKPKPYVNESAKIKRLEQQVNDLYNRL
jgi:transcriptional regulator with XRE-family HTH domain